MTTTKMTYEVTHSNGSRTTQHDSLESAEQAVRDTYGDACYIHDDWQSAGYHGDAEVTRLLVWSDETSSENDDGANAVASIRRWEE